MSRDGKELHQTITYLPIVAIYLELGTESSLSKLSHYSFLLTNTERVARTDSPLLQVEVRTIRAKEKFGFESRATADMSRTDSGKKKCLMTKPPLDESEESRGGDGHGVRP